MEMKIIVVSPGHSEARSLGRRIPAIRLSLWGDISPERSGFPLARE
jgi:hypothetical protein